MMYTRIARGKIWNICQAIPFYVLTSKVDLLTRPGVDKVKPKGIAGPLPTFLSEHLIVFLLPSLEALEALKVLPF